MTRKQIEVHYLSDGQYFVNNNISFKILMLISDLCDYSDSYVLVKRTRSVEGIAHVNKRNKKLIFKNNASFRSWTL